MLSNVDSRCFELYKDGGRHHRHRQPGCFVNQRLESADEPLKFNYQNIHLLSGYQSCCCLWSRDELLSLPHGITQWRQNNAKEKMKKATADAFTASNPIRHLYLSSLCMTVIAILIQSKREMGHLLLQNHKYIITSYVSWFSAVA